MSLFIPVRTFVVFIASLMCTLAIAQTTVRYVKSTPTGSGDGSSWENASANLDSLLRVAVAGDEIWVAKGTYKPSSLPLGATSSNTKHKTFYIPEGVALYGGFAGTESSISERDVRANRSVLSGDLNGDDVVSSKDGVPVFQNYGENAYHVVFTTSFSTPSLGVVLDGFTVTGGNAVPAHNENYSLYVRNINFYGNQGGGIYTYRNKLSVTNCTLVHNAAYQGGAIYASNDTIAIRYTLIAENTSTSKGAGISTYSCHNIIQKDTIQGNVATGSFDGSGGGMYTESGSNSIWNNVFVYNQSSHGGAAVHASGSASDIRNNIIKHNVNVQSGSGAGLYLMEGHHIVRGNLISENTSKSYGGGLFLWTSHSSKSIVDQNVFQKNYSGQEGGAIAVLSGTNIISNNTIVGNTALTHGGGIFIQGSHDTLVNNVIINNEAYFDGGGIYVFTNDTLVISTTTFVGNRGMTGGGLNTDNGKTWVMNSIFWANKASYSSPDYYAEANASNTFKNTLFQFPASRYSNSSTGAYHLGTGASDNLFAVDPLFINEADVDGADNLHQTADDGLRLKANSPLFNAGNNALVLPGYANDILGGLRIQDGATDLGAYEGPGIVTVLNLERFKTRHKPFPNPAQANQEIHFGQEVKHYSILNANGIEVQTGAQVDRVYLSALPRGLYIVRFDDEVYKLVVE